eukprot:ANDGO_05092.mRNA.1 hypothetical protein
MSSQGSVQNWLTFPEPSGRRGSASASNSKRPSLSCFFSLPRDSMSIPRGSFKMMSSLDIPSNIGVYSDECYSSASGHQTVCLSGQVVTIPCDQVTFDKIVADSEPRFDTSTFLDSRDTPQTTSTHASSSYMTMIPDAPIVPSAIADMPNMTLEMSVPQMRMNHQQSYHIPTATDESLGTYTPDSRRYEKRPANTNSTNYSKRGLTNRYSSDDTRAGSDDETGTCGSSEMPSVNVDAIFSNANRDSCAGDVLAGQHHRSLAEYGSCHEAQKPQLGMTISGIRINQLLNADQQKWTQAEMPNVKRVTILSKTGRTQYHPWKGSDLEDPEDVEWYKTSVYTLCMRIELNEELALEEFETEVHLHTDSDLKVVDAGLKFHKCGPYRIGRRSQAMYQGEIGPFSPIVFSFNHNGEQARFRISITIKNLRTGDECIVVSPSFIIKSKKPKKPASYGNSPMKDSRSASNMTAPSGMERKRSNSPSPSDVDEIEGRAYKRQFLQLVQSGALSTIVQNSSSVDELVLMQRVVQAAQLVQQMGLVPQQSHQNTIPSRFPSQP